MKTGTQLIAEERQRQIAVEGWTPEHDDTHVNGELAAAAGCYAFAAEEAITKAPGAWSPDEAWPWDPSWWKPSDDPIKNLTKAGPLIAAQIDMLLRKGAK